MKKLKRCREVSAWPGGRGGRPRETPEYEQLIRAMTRIFQKFSEVIYNYLKQDNGLSSAAPHFAEVPRRMPEKNPDCGEKESRRGRTDI